MLQDSGFILLPQLVHLQPLDKGGVRITTTIQTHHPTLEPDGVFEYQHSTGNSVQDSARKGFDLWAQTDLVALLDALILVRFQVETNYPRPSGNAVDSFGVRS